MDVIVDSNVVAADFRMRSASFASLFDYLRRTESKLVIPEVVREELLALFRREVHARTAKARSAWDSLRLMLTFRRGFEEPDLEREEANFAERLTSGSEGVEITRYECTVDTKEIVRRGANRIRPANDKGEEVRDVIIWLTVLNYSREFPGPVAFISPDRGFWRERAGSAPPDEKREPHPQIVRDIEAHAPQITIFGDIDGFTRANNLEEVLVDAAWASEHFRIEEQSTPLIRAASAAVSSHLAISRMIEGIEIASISFVGGSRYTTSAATKLAELTYRVSFDVKTSRASFSVFQYPSSHITLGNVANSNVNVSRPFAFNTVVDWQAPTQFGIISPPTYVSYGPAFFGYENEIDADMVSLTAIARFAIRIVDGNVERVDLRAFEEEFVAPQVLIRAAT